MLAEAGTTTRLTLVAPRAVLAEAGAAAFPALVAPLAVLADAGAAARSAIVAPLVVRALLADVALYWVRRRRGRCSRNCCSCLHGAKWQQSVAIMAGAFVRSRARLRTLLDALVCQCAPAALLKGICRGSSPYHWRLAHWSPCGSPCEGSPRVPNANSPKRQGAKRQWTQMPGCHMPMVPNARVPLPMVPNARGQTPMDPNARVPHDNGPGTGTGALDRIC